MWSGIPVVYSINQSMARLLWKRLIICDRIAIQDLERINSIGPHRTTRWPSFLSLKLNRIVVKGKKVKTVYDLQRCEPGNYELFCLLSWCH